MAVCDNWHHCECSGIVEEMELERDELLKALEWYFEKVEDLNRYGLTSESALAELRKDRGKRALEAIAKAKGESNEIRLRND